MYSLRKATKYDMEILIEFRIEFLKDFQELPSDEELLIFKENLKKFLIEKMVSDEFVAWLAVYDNEIVATSGISYLQRPPHFSNPSGKSAYIMNMYTKPEWRRKGIGSAIFEKLLEEIKKAGIQNISLHATPNGRNLYEKFGFTDSEDYMGLDISE